MKLSQIQKNINRTFASTLGLGHNQSNNIVGGFFGDNDMLRKKVDIKWERSLSTLLPYRYYDEEQDLYFNEVNYTDTNENTIKTKFNCGFILTGNPLSSISEEKIDILTNLFTDALPEGLIVQIINYASPRVNDLFELWRKERSREGDLYSELAQKRIDYFAKAKWQSLFNLPFVVRDFRVYIAIWLDIEEYPDFSSKLKELRRIFESNLQNIGILTSRLQPEDFLSFLDEVLNPAIAQQNKQEVKWDCLNDLNIQAVDSESHFEVKDDLIELRDDLVVSSFTVKEYPSIWFAWDMKNLLGSENNDFLRLSCPFAQILTFYVLSQEKSSGKAIIKASRAKSQAESKMGFFIPNIEQKAKDWKFVHDHIKKGRRMLEVQSRILLFAKKENLANEEETLKGLFKTLGWNISKDKLAQLPCFLSSLPFWLNKDRWQEMKLIKKVRTKLSWTAANIAPLIGEYKGTITEPQIMLFGKRGQPVFWNPFCAPNSGGNFNVAVVGKPGAGKSVFMQESFTSIRGAGGRVFIIDDGKSFKNSSQLKEGKFIEIKDNISINPFTMFEWEALQKDPDYRDAIQNFFTSLISQICRPINPINEDEKALISLAIWKVIETKGQNGSFTDIAQELLNVCQNERQKIIAESLNLSLEVFTKKYNRFFSGKSDIQMDNPLIVFELSNIKGEEMKDLKSVVMMILMHLIGEKIYKGDRKTRSSLIIDEAWAVLHGEGMMDFIEGYVRRIRKYGGNLMTGTQSINDYYKNPAARAVLENSQWKIFLAQNRDSIDYLKTHNVISMDKNLEEALKSLKVVKGCYSDVLIYGDSGWFIARLILDPFSVFLYSSTAEDVARLEDLKKQGLSIAEAVNQLAMKQFGREAK